jgi:hypothetical protein
MRLVEQGQTTRNQERKTTLIKIKSIEMKIELVTVVVIRSIVVEF